MKSVDEMTRVSTAMNAKATIPLTLGELEQIVDTIAPVPEQKIEVSKKHAKLLETYLASVEYPFLEGGYARIPGGEIGRLFGIPIHVRPYLKKLRLYTRKRTNEKTD